MNRWTLLGTIALLLAGAVAAAPRIFEKANDHALASLEAGNPFAAVRWLKPLALLGYADAQNNLGVIRLRGLDGDRDRETGRALLLAAEANGNLVAGYNLARLAENKHKTPLSDVAVTLARLEPLVRQGDPHAAAEMARHLYFNKRGELVNWIEERRTGLYAQAASSDDPIYQYLYARELWDLARPDDTEGMQLAVNVMLKAAEAGEARAMLHMGDMYWQSRQSFRDSFDGGYPGGDRYDWWSRSAEAGEPAGACRFAVNFFRSLRANTEPLPAFVGERPQLDADTRLALRYLETCSDVGKRPRRANPVFGRPALYLGRLGGGFETLKSSRSVSQMSLGLLLLEGRLVERDEPRGIALLEAAESDQPAAADILRSLRSSAQ